jgi:hypothetical protein
MIAPPPGQVVGYERRGHAQELSFEQTVPRSLVHRTALGEVYVADSLQSGDEEYVLAIQIPRAHCVWFDRRVAYHDPLSMAEAARQGAYVVVHRHIGLPPGLTFSLQHLELRVEELAGCRDSLTAPLQGVLTLRIVEQTRNARGLGSMTLAGDIAVDGRVAVRVSGGLVFLASDDFTALRAYQRRRNPPESAPPPASGPPLAAEASGRLDRRNSVLGEPVADGDEPVRYPVIIDQQHPSFFDHGYDHVPGPLILEAYRQAAIVLAHGAGALPSPVCALVGLAATFKDFAELDARLEVSAAVDRHPDGGGVAVELALHQFGKELSTARVRLCPYPDGTPIAPSSASVVKQPDPGGPQHVL